MKMRNVTLATLKVKVQKKLYITDKNKARQKYFK